MVGRLKNIEHRTLNFGGVDCFWLFVGTTNGHELARMGGEAYRWESMKVGRWEGVDVGKFESWKV